MQDNKDNNNVNDIDNKNADNSTDTSTTEKKDEYEKVCYVCHRTESRAGKMINMGNNIYICPDCMQRSFDAIYNSGINYDDMMKNIPGMGNIPGMNGFMSGDMNDNISQKQKIKKKNNKDDKDKKEDIDLKNIPAPHVIKEMLDQYVATKESIADSKKKLETEKAELQEMKTQTEAKQDSVQLLLNEKNKELQNVNAQIGEKSAQAKAYEDDIKAQEAKIAQMEAEIKKKEAEEAAKKAAEEAARKAAAAGKTNNSTAKGNTGSTTTTSTGSSSLRWPCPASGRITSGFGKRKSPTAGASSNHKGIDISASTGSSIVAAAGGTVSIATYSYSAGNYVVVNHGNGLSTVYMHCSQLLVSAGDTVKAGQTIAKVGSTGYSTGSHLHFAVRKNGSYVNPSSYVSP